MDPTNDVTGLSRYRKALTILFDPDRSEVKLKQIQVSGPASIKADWTLGGYLKLPWQPYIDTIDGHTVSQPLSYAACWIELSCTYLWQRAISRNKVLIFIYHHGHGHYCVTASGIHFSTSTGGIDATHTCISACRCCFRAATPSAAAGSGGPLIMLCGVVFPILWFLVGTSVSTSVCSQLQAPH